jgi:indole-3-glycerol phosphate synthase
MKANLESTMETILDKIVARKKEEVFLGRKNIPEADLLKRLANVPQPCSFYDALANAKGIGVIAEIKKASPSAGVLRESFCPATIAKEYESSGVDCISVLTDEHFFQGSLNDLQIVSETVKTPLLRKEFVIDYYQLLEAKIHGASAILFIAEVLLGDDLKHLVGEAIKLGLEPLVELYDACHLTRVLDSGTRLVGINNRDLRTFVTSLDHTLDLLPKIPKSFLVVSESGIQTNKDVEKLKSAGAKAILVGETFMRSGNITTTLKTLKGLD